MGVQVGPEYASIAIAKDIAEIILADQFEKKRQLPEIPEKMSYSLIIDY